MFNKKILAVAVAASFSFNASAVVDLDNATAVTYASQSIVDGGTLVPVANLNNTAAVGFVLPADTQFYVRYEFTNATLLTNPLISTSITSDNGGSQVTTLAAGGTIGDDFAVFTYESDGSTAADDAFTLTLDAAATDSDLSVVSVSAPIGLTYKLFQDADAFAALNTGVGAIGSATANIATFVTGQVATFVAQANIAEVADGFTTFANTVDLANTDDDQAVLGSVIVAAGVATILNAADSTQILVDEAFTTPTNITAALTGDFSVGDWTLEATADCGIGGGVAVTVDVNDTTIATAAAADYTSLAYLCVTVDGTEIIPRVSDAYTLTLDGALNTGVSADLGTIGYDTTSIKIDYITVNTAYAQKIFLTNTSSSPADYTTTFTLESGSTATGGTGTVPANTMITVKASDFMIITGDALRGSAVIEIEGNVGDIQASTQTINLTTKDTDTVTLVIE